MGPEKRHHIKKLISLGIEGNHWIFRKSWEDCQATMLHDIICLANTIINRDGYILMGISEDGEVIGVDSAIPNAAALSKWLEGISFAGPDIPHVKIDRIDVDGKNVDVLTVLNSYNTPFYLSSSLGYLVGGAIYSRTQAGNTPVDSTSTYAQVEQLWKKRFRLLSSPIEQIFARLLYKDEWHRRDEVFHNDYFPEFGIAVLEADAKRPAPEFYSYHQPSNITSYCDVEILYREFALETFRTVILNNGSFHTTVPQWGFILDKTDNTVLYKYRFMIQNSPESILQEFLFNEDNEDARIGKQHFDEIVLYFVDEDEKQVFTEILEKAPSIIQPYLDEQENREFDIPEDSEANTESLLKTAFAFKQLLDGMRNGNFDGTATDEEVEPEVSE